MSQERSKPNCPDGGGGIPTIRNRYFTGKYMTARDFADEQHYMLSRQRLHNRLFHGWGIVCGLEVDTHPNADCQPGWIEVKAGVAIDCNGREIFLPENTAVEVPFDQLPLPVAEVEEPDEDDDESGWEQGESAYEQASETPSPADRGERRRRRNGLIRRYKRQRRRRHDRGEGEETDQDWSEEWPENGLLVCLRYCEAEVEPVPALYAEGGCDPTKHEANRIREVAGIELHRLSDMPGCWPLPSGWPDFPCRDDCDEAMPGPGGLCLESDCFCGPCGPCVPLALLVPLPGSTLEVPNYHIDSRGRKQLLTDYHLTHIVGINWKHGEEITLRELCDKTGSELRIKFDRKIMPADGIATGINRRTFTVEYGDLPRHLEFLPFCGEPYLDVDGCTAVYPLEASYLSDKSTTGCVAGNFVYVRLSCDFVLDCHGTPVDGNHLRGRLPSGDERPGGEFVSWFRVVHNHGYEEG